MYKFNENHEVIAGILTAPLAVRLALATDSSSDASLHRTLMLDTSPEVRMAALRSARSQKAVAS